MGKSLELQIAESVHAMEVQLDRERMDKEEVIKTLEKCVTWILERSIRDGELNCAVLVEANRLLFRHAPNKNIAPVDREKAEYMRERMRIEHPPEPKLRSWQNEHGTYWARNGKA